MFDPYKVQLLNVIGDNFNCRNREVVIERFLELYFFFAILLVCYLFVKFQSKTHFLITPQ